DGGRLRGRGAQRPRRGRCGPAAARAASTRRYRARQGLARGGARARVAQPGLRERGMMGSPSGRILIAGTASLLMCLFLSPRFIAFVRRREFGQNIREEGPQGHQTKAGTPTLGGIVIMVAFAVPFLILTDFEWQSVGVFAATIACAMLGFADDYTKIAKRRSLGLRARTKLIVTVLISVGLWWIATHKAHITSEVRLRFVDATIDVGPLFPVLIYLVVAGTTSGVNLTDGRCRPA